MGASSAEVRIWRDQKTAKALDATLVAVDGETITLEFPNGRKYKLDVSRFHADDQAYVKRWLEDAKERAKFAKEAVKDSEGRVKMASADLRRAIKMYLREKKGEGDYDSTRNRDNNTSKKVRTDVSKYEIQVDTARNAPPISDILVNYTVYKRSRFSNSEDRKQNSSKIVSEKGSEKISKLEPGARHSLMTKSISTVSTTETWKKDKKTHSKKTSESLLGIVVELSVGGAQVLKIEEPSGLLANVERGRK